MRAIVWIFILSFVAFSLHFASFAFIPATRGLTVRVSHALLAVAGNAMGDNYLTETNPEPEYPGGSLHATEEGQTILIVFWSLVYLIGFSLIYLVVARIRRA